MNNVNSSMSPGGVWIFFDMIAEECFNYPAEYESRQRFPYDNAGFYHSIKTRVAILSAKNPQRLVYLVNENGTISEKCDIRGDGVKRLIETLKNDKDIELEDALFEKIHEYFTR